MSVRIEDHSKEVLSALDLAIEAGLTEIGETAVGYAADLAPYKTGLLRNSITYALSGKSAAISSYRAEKSDETGEYSGTAPSDSQPGVYVGTNVEYAQAREFGWHGTRATPFLRPAATEHTAEYRRLMESAMKG